MENEPQKQEQPVGNVVELFPAGQEKKWRQRIRRMFKSALNSHPERIDPLASKQEQQQMLANIRAAQQAPQAIPAENKELKRVA